MTRFYKIASCAVVGVLLFGCSKKPADDRPATRNTNQATDAAPADPLADLDARLFAHLRVQTYVLTDKHVTEYVPQPTLGTGAVPQTARAIASLAGDLPASALRPEGNVEMLFFAPLEGREVGWALHVPVTSSEAFVKELGAKEDPTEVGLLSAQRGTTTLYVNTKKVDFPSRTTTDDGAYVTLSATREGALYTPALITRHATEQIDQVQLKLWPRRAQFTPRYASMADELRSLLSVNGHALAPARAGIVNLQSLLYSEFGSPSNWPETISAIATFKIRNNAEGKPYPKAFRIHVDVPVDSSPRLLKLWGALDQSPKAQAPPLPLGQSKVVLKLGRADVEQAGDAILPERYRMLLAATGEDDMRVLQNSIFALLDHDRGATSIATYAPRYPLSGEILFAFDVMDSEKLPEAANVAQKVLVNRFIKPLHLGSLTDVDESPFRDSELGLEGSRATFTVPARGGKEFTLGSCWAMRGPSFYAYIGLDPCAALSEKVAMGGPDEPSPFSIEAPLRAALETLFIGPNQRVDALSKSEAAAHVSLQPLLVDGAHVFHLDLSTDKAMLSELSGLIPELSEVWSYASSYDVSSIASRASVEQAIYQEPGIMVLGPPGLLGALPPTYYFGLPFSVPPAPPAQLKQAILGDSNETDGEKR